MASVMIDLSMIRGDSASLAVTVGDLGAAGLNAFNDARFTAKRDVSDSDANAIISKSLNSGVTITTVGDSNTNGVLTVSIAPADTQALPTGYTVALFYDVRLYDSGGDAYTVAQGMLTVTPTATQATS
ncbi:MAG TPA: hypothetical protein VKQ36_09550 [Ktedonobacterales bacterium]|nr:hypothetical protein [Ktedonobacterales bacterium]